MLCVLESISYTRKDGQYLSWDSDSGRKLRGKVFHKKKIEDFDRAIVAMLSEIINDTLLRQTMLVGEKKGNVNLSYGSCLDILPTIADSQYDLIITSPPYCNRYDYTRTYALELALLGVDEIDLVNLRHQMLKEFFEYYLPTKRIMK